MTDAGDSRHFPAVTAASASDPRQFPAVTLTAVGDPLVPLMNLAAVRDRMDSLQRFLSDSVNRNLLLADHQMTAISTEIAAAIRHVIVNGAALLANSQNSESSGQILFDSNKVQIDENLADLDPVTQDRKSEAVDLDSDKEEIDHCEIVELDAVELLAEHIHFCEICGKGFKRDANLRMHMRAHGNQFKTPEALAKPQASAECIFKISKSGEQATIGQKTRFSCPYVGCNRNKQHKNFRPLKSVICVKNHFKRSHCPKMYACNRCHKKSFSVVADLKSHLRHCGESRWRCSCGTTFSRKDKLFGHMALFEGHMPAIADNEAAAASSVAMEEDTVAVQSGAAVAEEGSFNVGLDSGIYDGFGSIENEYMQEMLRSCSSSDTWKNWMMEEQYKYTFW